MQSNSELIQAVLVSKDARAFETLIKRYERLVWTVAWRVLRDYHATQDVTQETFLIAHRRLCELRDPGALGFWLSRIAQREAQRARRETPGMRSVDGIDLPVQKPPATFQWEHQSLIAAVGKLPEHERIVTVLRYFNGHSVAEVSELTGRPIGTVTKQISRALARLKTNLGKSESVPDVPCKGAR